MSDFVILDRVQGAAGASGAGVSGSGVVSVVNGGLVSPAISGTIGQLLAMATATTVAFFALSGDVISSGVTPGLCSVAAISGVAGIAAIHAGATTLQWDTGVVSPAITQASTSGATGTSLTIQAQGSTAATGTGGNLVLSGGTASGGTSGTPGNVVVSLPAHSAAGAAPKFVVGGDGMANYFALQQAAGFAAGTPAIYFGIGAPGNPTGTNYLFVIPADSNLHFNNGLNTDTVFEINGVEKARLSSASNFLELGVGGLTWTAIASAPTISQLSTSSSPGLNMTVQAQGSTSATGVGGNLILSGGPAAGATSGTPGNVVMSWAAPTGGGAEAAFQIQRAGQVIAQAGLQAGGSFVQLWMGKNVSPSNTNYVITSDANSTFFNAPTTVSAVIANATYLWSGNVSGVQLFSGTLSLAGGVGVLGLHSASSLPNILPVSGAVLAVDGVTNPGLHYYGPSTSFVDFMIAPTCQGSANSQQGKVLQYAGEARTTTNTAVTILTIPLATSATNAGIWCVVQGRDVSAGTVTDGVTIATVFQFKNVGGTVTQGATAATQLKAADTSMNTTPTLTATVSGTNILIQVNGITSVTIDWTAVATALIT